MSTMPGGDQVDLLDDPDALEAFLNDDSIILSCISQQFDVGAQSGSMGQAQVNACANNSFTKPVQIVQPTVQQTPRASHISPAAQLNSTKTSSTAPGQVAATSNSTSQPVGVGSQPSTSALAPGATKCSPASSGATVPTALVQQNVNIMNISLQPAASSAASNGTAPNQTHGVSVPMQLPVVQVPVSMAAPGATASLGSAPTATFSLIQVPNGQLILQPLMPTANLQLVTLGPSQLGVTMAGASSAPQQPQSQQHAAPTSFVVNTPSQFADANANAHSAQRPAAPGPKARGPANVSTPRPVLKAAESSTPIRLAASPLKPAAPAPAPASTPVLAPAPGKATSKRPANAIVVTNYSKQAKRTTPAVAPAPAAPSSKTGQNTSNHSGSLSIATASTSSSATASKNAAPTTERQRNVVWRGAVERQLRAAESLAPFKSPDDALERLIAYHLYQDSDRRPDADAAAFASWPLVLSDVQRGGHARESADKQFDDAFEKTCQCLKQRCDGLFATWSHMQARESCLNSNLTAKCEQLLLDRLQLDTFRDLHEREKHGPVETEVQEPVATVELKTETEQLRHDLKCVPKLEPESYEDKKPLSIAVADPDSADLQSEHAASTNFELDAKIDLDLAAREERRRKKKRKEERRRRHELPVENAFVTSIATEPNRVKLVIRMKAPSSAQPTTGSGVASLTVARSVDQHEHTNAQADEEARAAAEQLLLDG